MNTSSLNPDRGIPTFAGFQLAELDSIIPSAVAIFGVPTQSTHPVGAKGLQHIYFFKSFAIKCLQQ